MLVVATQDEAFEGELRPMPLDAGSRDERIIREIVERLAGMAERRFGAGLRKAVPFGARVSGIVLVQRLVKQRDAVSPRAGETRSKCRRCATLSG